MKNEVNYWEKRYREGGNSGNGSIGEHKEWKWNMINKYIPKIDNLIDVGCGDLNFQESKNYENYTGIDISKTIIEINKKAHPNWNFIHSSADIYIPNIKADVVFCHDLLFHIIDERQYVNILKNLTKYSNEYISIFTWHSNPIKKFKIFKTDCDGVYRKYRDFTKYFYIFQQNGFNLICEKKSDINNYGSLYIFKKVKQ